MNDFWLKTMKDAMKTNGISEEALAEHFHLSKSEVQCLMTGKMRLSLMQLSELAQYLHMDMDQIMGYREQDMDLILSDDLEIQLNEIARSIPQHQRANFVEAVRYLAVLFHTKEAAETKNGFPVSKLKQERQRKQRNTKVETKNKRVIANDEDKTKRKETSAQTAKRKTIKG